MTYVVTWIAGLAAVTVVLTLLASRLPGGQGDGGWGAWLRLVLGVVLIAAAVRMWLGRSRESTPAWLSALIDAGPREAVRYGLLMSAANPKELLMAVAAALVVGGSDVGPATAAVVIAVFLPRARLPPDGAAHRAIGALHILLPGVPTVINLPLLNAQRGEIHGI